MEIQKLTEFVEDWLKGTPCFLVDISAGADDRIVIEVDSEQSVDIDMCVALTRAIEAAFPRDEEDYELEVGSAGLTSPLRIPAQYRKHIGHDMEVLTAGGRKIRARLVDADDNGVTLEWQQKTKVEGTKKPVMEDCRETFAYAEIKKAVWEFKF